MLFRRAYRAMTAGGNLDELAAVVAPDFVDHGPVASGTRPVQLEDYFERGDRACAAMRITGTHSGPLMGLPPTGRSIDISGVDVVRIGPDGRCVDLPEQERSSEAPATV